MSVWGKLDVQKIDGPAPGSCVFRATGTLTDSGDGFALLEAVRETLRMGSRRLVLSLAGLERLDSSGVGILASCYTSALNAGGTLALAELQERPRALLKIVHLLTVIPEFPTEQAALAAEAGSAP